MNALHASVAPTRGEPTEKQTRACLLEYHALGGASPTHKALFPLHPSILATYFENDASFVGRDEYADGSCFFHAVVTCLNINEVGGGGRDGVFRNIRQRLRAMVQSKHGFDTFMHKYLFVRNDYKQLSSVEQTRLGHKLRRLMRHTLKKEWAAYWGLPAGNSNKATPASLRRVHSVAKVSDMLNQPSVWADVYMIMFVMHVLHLNIWFFDNENQRIYCGAQGTDVENQPTIMILWTNHSHFQPIVRLRCRGSDRDKPYVQSLFTFRDDPIVRHIDSVYKKIGCDAVSRDDIL